MPKIRHQNLAVILQFYSIDPRLPCCGFCWAKEKKKRLENEVEVCDRDEEIDNNSKRLKECIWGEKKTLTCPTIVPVSRLQPSSIF